MADTINIPGLGPVKKTWVYVAGAVTLGIVGYAWWNARNQAPTDFVGASPDDFGATDYDSPLGSSGGNSTGNFDSTDPEAIDTNAKWTQKAIELLASYGWESTVVGTALGKYLSRQGVTENEATIIQLAIAAVGPPPVGGPYTIKPALPNPPSTGDPNPDPVDLEKGQITDSQNIWTFAIRIDWAPIPGATGYKITVSPNSGAGSDNFTGGTAKMIRGLTPGTTYTITVAGRKGNTIGPASDPVSIRTPTAAEGGHTS